MNDIRHIDFKKAERLFEARKTVFHTASFIYFMAFYTSLNSVLSLLDSMRFVGLALNICTMVDEIIINAPIIMIIIGLLFNLTIVSFFIFLAKKATKKELWAYRLALIIYLIDTLLIFILPFEYKLANFILHLFIIWLVWSEYEEYKDYFKLERDLYLPDWALTEKSNVLFIKKSDFDLQPDESSQINFYKKAIQYQEESKPANAINYYSKAISIWNCIPIVNNKDKDWYAMALINRAILKKSIRSKNTIGILKDLTLAYDNFKKVINEEVKPTEKNLYANQHDQFVNYEFVDIYFVQCSYYLLSQLMSNFKKNRNTSVR